MPPLDPFTPPTDNLYKFVALSGVLLFVSFLFLAWKIRTNLAEELFDAKKTNQVLARRIQLMREFLKDPDRTREDVVKSQADAIEVGRLQDENAIAVEQLEWATRGLKYFRRVFASLLLLSAGLAYCGFHLWYVRVQVYQDAILRAEAQEKSGRRPNKAPEPTTTSVTSPAAQEPRQP